MSRSRAALAAFAIAAGGCRDRPAPSNAAPADAGAETATEAARIQAIAEAEARRNASAISADDLASRDVAVRRAAVRALARIGGEGQARALLLRALADEDVEVIRWAAYGLGHACKGHEDETVGALVAQAVARPHPPRGKGAEGPEVAIARAVGRCAAEASEATLVQWLGGPPDRAVAAALGLGDLAGAKKRLREESLVTLLNAAAGSAGAPPIGVALFPFGRLEAVPPSIHDRLFEVASARLRAPGQERSFAIKAIARAGSRAVPELARLFAEGSGASAAERAEAARQLARLGDAGQGALEGAALALAPSSEGLALGGLAGDELGVFLAVLGGLKGPGRAQKKLRELAALSAPPGAPAPLLRRVSHVRCAAAAAVVGERHADPLLAACDLALEGARAAGVEEAKAAEALPRGLGARAQLAVLRRGGVSASERSLLRRYALEGDPRSRELALEIVGEHEDVPGAPELLAKALAAEEPGVAATAAKVIAEHPLRAHTPPPKAKRRKRKEAPPEPEPAPEVRAALLAALDRAVAGAPSSKHADPELVAGLLDAAGALGTKEAIPKLEAFCASPYPVPRERAARALATLTRKKVVCAAPEAGGDLPPEWAKRAEGEHVIVFESDAGEVLLRLDGSRAPVAVARALDLARAGFFDGMPVHRVVPGFVTQFGSPSGDGFGGPDGLPPLRCETSPAPFGPSSVGVALSGRDTGSSQLFVTHALHPHLDGHYALVGRAEGPWDTFVEGDRLLKAKVDP